MPTKWAFIRDKSIRQWALNLETPVNSFLTLLLTRPVPEAVWKSDTQSLRPINGKGCNEI